MKHLIFTKWFSINHLKIMRSKQLYLNELGYVYGDEEKTKEIVNKLQVMSLRFLKKKMVNELKIRTRMMEILRRKSNYIIILMKNS